MKELPIAQVRTKNCKRVHFQHNLEAWPHVLTSRTVRMRKNINISSRKLRLMGIKIEKQILQKTKKKESTVGRKKKIRKKEDQTRGPG